MPAPDAIEVEIDVEGVAIVTLRGEHDLNSRSQLARTLQAVSRRRRVVVDLSECSFIDSTVISELLRATNTLRKRGGQLELVIPGSGESSIRHVFELMSLQRLLPIHESRAAAVDFLDTAPPVTTATGMRLRALSDIIDASLVEDGEGQAPAHPPPALPTGG